MIEHDNLEEFADAERYDLEDASETGVEFYASLARETGGPVLEVACGTGRVAIPIARLGIPVVGLDVVPGMLERARVKSAGLPTRWVEGDARSFDLDERFRLVFLTGNAFQAFLTRADQASMLARVRAHLEADGLLAFETRNPRWAGSAPAFEAGEGTFTLLEDRDEAPAGSYLDGLGREVRVSRAQAWDHVAQVLHWTTWRRWDEGGKERSSMSRIAVRFTWPQELEGLLEHAGFEVVRRYGDWDLSPLSASSPSIIVVCRLR
ncbi:MAG: class I SAM-dependent methyltransferase [Dehalococcoidia bacterium]